VIRNNSTQGRLAFSSEEYFSTNEYSNSSLLEKADVDGDGRLDVFLNLGSYVIRNTSIPGTISFDLSNKALIRPVGYKLNEGRLASADLDLDGKMDLVTWRAIGQWAIHRNRVAEDLQLPVCPSGGKIEIPSDILGSAYQWQVSTGPDQPFTNLLPSSVYDSTNSKNLLLINPPTTFYGYSYRCMVDGKPSAAFKLKFETRWRSDVIGLWYYSNWNCNGLPDQNTDVIVEKGKVQVDRDLKWRSLLIYPGATVELKPGATLQFN
jgi:hypothetical protein